MKLRAIVCCFFVFLLGVGGCTGSQAGNIFQQPPSIPPETALFLPKSAPVAVSLVAAPERLDNWRQAFPNAKTRRNLEKSVTQLRQSLLDNTGFDYKRDIAPWLGEEVALAVTTLDIDRDRTNGVQPGYLLVADTKDPQLAREFLDAIWQPRAAAGIELAFEDYKGVILIHPQRSDDAAATDNTFTSNLATAMVADRFVLFANHPKVLRSAINNVQAARNLRNDRSFRAAWEALPLHRFGFAYTQLPQLEALLAGRSSFDTVPAASRELAIALDLQSGGLLAQGALIVPEGLAALPETTDEGVGRTVPAMEKAMLTQPGAPDIAVARYLPANSSLAIVGTDLNQFWNQQAAAVVGGNNLIAQLLRPTLERLAAQWHLDFSQDIFAWVQGDYALAAIPGASPDRFQWVFAAEKSPQTETAIARLDAIAQEQGYSVGAFTLEEQTIYAWTKLVAAPKTVTMGNRETDTRTLQTVVRGVRTTVGDRELFASSLAAMDAALHAPTDPLVSSEAFLDGTRLLPDPNDGYVYLDWQVSQSLLERQVPLFKFLELAGKPLFDRLRSLTLSSYSGEANLLRTSVFFRLE